MTQITAEMEREIFASNLQKLLDRKKITQSDLSREMKMPVTTINSWLKAKKYPGLKNQQRLAEFFNVTRRDLLSNEINNIEPRAQRIPILGTIACGKPIFSEENIEDYVYDYSNKITDENYFYLRTKGDSMTPSIPNDALVLIRAQSVVENGEIAACVVGHDRELTLKRFKKQGDTIVLIADNSAYQPIIITSNPEDYIQIVGKAVSYYKDLES